GGRALHEEELAARAVRVTLHHHGTIADVREEQGRDVRVVLEEVAFGEPELRPEQLAQVREPDLAVAELEDGVIAVAWNVDAARPGRERAPPPRGCCRMTSARGARRGNADGAARHQRPSPGNAAPRSGSSFGGRRPFRTAPRTGT